MKKKKKQVIDANDLPIIEKLLKADISVRQIAMWWEVPLTTFRRILIKNNIKM